MDIFQDVHFVLYIVSLITGILIPVGIVLGLSNVRNSRYELVKELEIFLKLGKNQSQEEVSLPSFDLIKYKYMPDEEKWQSGIRAKGYRINYKYIIPTILFTTTTTIGFLLISAHTEFNDLLQAKEVTPHNHLINILTVTFISGYIWSVQYLIRRVANFDLSPVSFYRTLLHILLGLVIMWAIYFIFIGHEIDTGTKGNPQNYIYAVAFLVGLQPTLFINYLASRFPSIKLKRTSESSNMLREELPLDTIMGIDTFIKFRLSEFEVEDVQNLATLNPIQLFIETPYGFFEIIDWVAQAQLILAVGSDNAVTLRKMNVRTIFDLERMIYSPELKSSLLNALKTSVQDSNQSGASRVIIPSQRRQQHQHAPTNSLPNSEAILNEMDQLEGMIAFIRDDLHVQRLRQIWDIIAWETARR